MSSWPSSARRGITRTSPTSSWRRSPASMPPPRSATRCRWCRRTPRRGYLLQLAEAGVPVVPTDVLRPGDWVRLPGDVALVVKPTISAAARDTERYAPDQQEAATAHAQGLLDAGRSVLVQPYVEDIDDAGRPASSTWATACRTPSARVRASMTDARFVNGLYLKRRTSRRVSRATPKSSSPSARSTPWVRSPRAARVPTSSTRVCGRRPRPRRPGADGARAHRPEPLPGGDRHPRGERRRCHRRPDAVTSASNRSAFTW